MVHPSYGTNATNSLNSTSLFASNGSLVLSGSHFTDPLLVTPIVVSGICAIAFIALAVMSWLYKSTTGWSRRGFVTLSSLLVTMMVGFVRTTSDGIIHEFRPKVPKAYLALPALKPVFNNTTDVLLIGVIYFVVKNRFRHIKNDEFGYDVWQMIHKGIIFLLALLAAADTIFYIYVQVATLGHTRPDETVIGVDNYYRKIHLAYTTIYFAVSVEIMTCAVFIAKRSEVGRTRSRIVTYLLTLVAPALALRAAMIFAIALGNIYLQHAEPPWAIVITTVLWGFGSIAIYLGLVLIQKQKDWPLDIAWLPVAQQAAAWERGDVETFKQPIVSYDPYPSPPPEHTLPMSNHGYDHREYH